MALEIPHALIRKLQLSTREAAGVQHYDPDDPSVNTFPTFRDCISSLEPSVPMHLRCGNCHGKLLRGAESVVCVYCGTEQPRDGLAETISFNTSVGCRNLLDFLDLDQSEPVTLHADSRESGRSEGAIKVMFLSDLLDLKMRWPHVKEELESSTVSKTLSRSIPMDFSVGDLDKFISETKSLEVSGDSSVSQDVLQGHAIYTEAPLSSASKTFASFENIQSKELVQSSVETKKSYLEDSFADWDADFQSANSEIPAAESKPLDPIPGAFKNHTIINFLPLQDSNDNQQSATDVDKDLSTNADWIASDTWQTAGTKTSDTDQLKEPNSAGVGESKSNDFLRPTELPEEKNNHHDNTSIDVWQDYPRSQGSGGVSFDSWTQNGERNNLPYEDPSSNIKTFGTSERNGDGNFDYLNSWQDFTSSQAPQGALKDMTLLNAINTSKEMEFGIFSQSSPSSETSKIKIDNLTDTFEDKEFGSLLKPGPSGTTAVENDFHGKGNFQLKAASSDRTTGAEELSADNIKTQSPHLMLENLLSQMNDLSFMLENDLSIPKNQEDR